MRGSATNCGPMSPEVSTQDLTDDAVLGGRLKILQPRRGHRVGHDAILLAAATAAVAGERAVDLGAGVGSAGLALAVRVEGLSVTLVDIDPDLTALARENATRNGLADRVSALALDVTAPDGVAAALAPSSIDRVLMNPPFNDPARQQVSPDLRRQRAHAAPRDLLRTWVETAGRILRPGGTVTLIFHANGIADVLHALSAGYGAIAVLPIHPTPSASAIRILARAVKGSHAPISLRQGLVLNNDNGKPSVQADAVLRHAAALSFNP